MNPSPPVSSTPTKPSTTPSTLEMTISALIVFVVGGWGLWWLNTSVFPPVTQTVTIKKLDKDCGSGGLFSRDCRLSAFDGSQIYDLTQAQFLALEPGRLICVTSSLTQGTQIALGACRPSGTGGLR